MTSCSVIDVGPGDLVKIGSAWKTIRSNTAFGEKRVPRSWIVVTEDGESYGMFQINRYAKATELSGAR